MKRGSSIVALFGLLVVFGFATVGPVYALTTTYVGEINYTLEQPFGGQTIIQSWGEYVQTLYEFSLGLVSIIAVVLIMIGGIRWIAAAGNESAIGEAREMITSAVIGLIIALLSYTLLVFINPALVEQNFAVAKIPVPNGDTDFWKHDWCNKTDISGETCNSESSGEVQCSEVICGDTAVYEKDSKNSICRGGKCEAGDGSPNCYPKPSNPYSEAACQMKDCGNWARTCYIKFSDPAKIEDYNACLCGYYQTTPMKLMGATGDPDAYSAAQLVQFSVFCSENILQTTLVSDITTNPKGYYTPTSLTGLKDIGLNCNFGCEMYNAASSTTVSTVRWDSLDSIASWLTATPDHIIECRHS